MIDKSKTYSEAIKKGWVTRRKNGRVPTHEQSSNWGKLGSSKRWNPTP